VYNVVHTFVCLLYGGGGNGKGQGARGTPPIGASLSFTAYLYFQVKGAAGELCEPGLVLVSNAILVSTE